MWSIGSRRVGRQVYRLLMDRAPELKKYLFRAIRQTKQPISGASTSGVEEVVRASRNPLSVLGGIQLCGLPGPPAVSSHPVWPWSAWDNRFILHQEAQHCCIIVLTGLGIVSILLPTISDCVSRHHDYSAWTEEFPQKYSETRSPARTNISDFFKSK